MLGRFVDASLAYRFGPPGHDTIVVSLEQESALVSQAVRFPGVRPTRTEGVEGLGLEGSLEHVEGGLVLAVRSRRLAYGVRLKAAGWTPSDDAFCVEPGHERRIDLVARGEDCADAVVVTALNLDGRLCVPIPTR